MPGRRIRASQKRPRKPRPTVATLARKVSAIQNQIEYKRVQTLNTTAPVVAGSLFALNSVAEGDTSANRSGFRIQAKSLELRLEVTMNATTTAQNQFVRMVIFRDNQQQDSTLPTINLLMGAATSNSTDLRSWVNRKRFKIYSDKTIYVGNTSEGRPAIVLTKLYKRLNFEMKYSLATAASFNKNGLFCLLIGSETGNPPVIEFESRMTYSDL